MRFREQIGVAEADGWSGIVWEGAVRLCPARPLPVYRHLPSQTPHPTRDPRGHSYSAPHPFETKEPWELCEAYRFGIDLYHQGYLWESHEAWEALWRATGRNSAEGVFLQALIRNSAALLKYRVGNGRGTRQHGKAAWQLLRQAASLNPSRKAILGVDLGGLQDSVEACYRPLWESPDGFAAAGQPPRIVVLA